MMVITTAAFRKPRRDMCSSILTSDASKRSIKRKNGSQISSLGSYVVYGVLEEKCMSNVCTNGRTTA